MPHLRVRRSGRRAVPGRTLERGKGRNQVAASIKEQNCDRRINKIYRDKMAPYLSSFYGTGAKNASFTIPSPIAPSLCRLAPVAAASLLHSQKAERFGHVVVVAARRLPGDAFAVWGRALESVEVNAQFLAGLRLSFIDLVNRDAHLAVPDFLFGDDAGLHFKARIPLPVVVDRVGAAVNIQIYPFAVRRDLKFGVAFDVLEIAADEDFGDVPIPELVGLGSG